MIAFSSQHRVLVTGASSGIGRAVALLANRLGATVLASGREAQRLSEAKDAAEAPQRFHTVPRDLLADPSSLSDWVGELRQTFGKLHGLVCCAGRTWNVPLSCYDLGQANEAFTLCCHAPLLLAKGFCDRRNHDGPGASIVFVAALAAVDPMPGLGMYAAAKAALVCAGRCLSKEVASRGVRVNCISPGLVQTPMLDATVQCLGETFLQREQARYPLGLGQPPDVAHLAAFLLSDCAGWLTGQNILLTGGL